MKRCGLLAAVAAASLPQIAHAQTPAGEAAPAPPTIAPPVVQTHVDAVYPESAHKADKHGDVVLAVTVDVHGHVSAVDVIESGGADLDQAAIVAARQWTFEPARRNGKPVAAKIRIPFHFAPPAQAVEVVETPQPTSQATAHAHAHEEPKTEVAPVEDVIIHGRPVPPSRGPSDFNVRIGELQRVYRNNASDLLQLAPGIVLSNEGGEGHAEQIFLRGYDAGEGQDLEFTVDGVPINEPGNIHGGGYADTHFILPELVESLRFVEGPFDPRQGNFAVAGSAEYQLGLTKRGTTVGYRGGSFDTHRLVLLWGPKNESVHTFGGAELYRTDGFGQNRAADRASAMAQYEGKVGERGSYRVMAQGFATKYGTAGVVRQDDFDAGRIGYYDSYDRRQGGSSSRYSLAADIVSRSESTLLTQQLFLIRRDFRVLENFTGFVEDEQLPNEAPHAQRGDLVDLSTGSWSIGSRGASRIGGNAFGERQELEVGYFARGDVVSSSADRLAAATGEPYKTDTRLDASVGNVALYGDGNLRANSWLALRGGLRGEVFTFDVHNHAPAEQHATAIGSTILPRTTLLLGPFQHFTFTGSYGRGARALDPSLVTQDARAPFARLDAVEGGVAYARETEASGLVVRSIFFHTHVDRDILFDVSEGRNALANGTTRVGWAGSARFTGRFIDESASMTIVRATFDDTHLPVPYVPGFVVRSDTALHTELPFRIAHEKTTGALAAGLTYVGPRDLPFGAVSDRIFTVDASATLGWSNVELGVIASNLFGNRYPVAEYNYASNFRADQPASLTPMRHLVAGAPRTVFGTVTINFGGS
jgi:TonB family protein